MTSLSEGITASGATALSGISAVVLVGDRQVIDALELLSHQDARLVIGVMHHPADWLKEFDKTCVENRLYDRCDFLHRGHLHEQNVRLLSRPTGSQCAVCAAGAAFAGRQFENSYSIIQLNLANSFADIHTFVYSRSAFQAAGSERVKVSLRGSLPGSLNEFIRILKENPNTSEISDYLAALIYGGKSEIPIASGDEITFGSKHLIDERPDALSVATREFLQLEHLLKAYADDVPFVSRVRDCQVRIHAFADQIRDISVNRPGFRNELNRRNEQSRQLPERGNGHFSQSKAYLTHLFERGDWEALEHAASRLKLSSDQELARLAARMLGLSLCRSASDEKSKAGMRVLVDLARDHFASSEDIQLAITCLHAAGQAPEAKALLLEKLNSNSAPTLRKYAYALAIETGDRGFREKIDSYFPKAGS